MKFNKLVFSLAAVGLLAGCQLTPEESSAKEIVSEWSHRPIVDQLEELPSVVPVLIQDGNEVARSYKADEVYEDSGSAWSKLTSSFAFTFGDGGQVDGDLESVSDQSTGEQVAVSESVVKQPLREIVSAKGKVEEEHKMFNEKLRQGVEESYIAQSSTYILEQESTHEFLAFSGESYGSVLSRWLSEQGYGVVGWYLDDLPRAIVESPIEESVSYDMTLDDAISNLFTSMKDADVEIRGKAISGAEVEDQFLEVRLDADLKQAVVTSSEMPTTLFMVEPGSLKKNFVRLGEHFGWNVSEEFYIAKDYKVSFGFPVVAEKGNVKVALEQLLAPFVSLRGALVPSVREIYVVQERE